MRFFCAVRQTFLNAEGLAFYTLYVAKSRVPKLLQKLHTVSCETAPALSPPAFYSSSNNAEHSSFSR